MLSKSFLKSQNMLKIIYYFKIFVFLREIILIMLAYINTVKKPYSEVYHKKNSEITLIIIQNILSNDRN